LSYGTPEGPSSTGDAVQINQRRGKSTTVILATAQPRSNGEATIAWNNCAGGLFEKRYQWRVIMENAPYLGVVGWIVLGLIAGFIASKIVNRTGEGIFLDVVLGVVGALVGGFLFNAIGSVGVTGLNIWSMFVAVIGAVVVLLIYHMVAGRRTI
jgi:uncharacterized membrane protein YeaQ/YmgE (transglycosylase-associated protein family)